jgi:hypothetical protein
MRLSRREFNSGAIALGLLPFLRRRRYVQPVVSPSGPTCIYQTGKSWEDLPEGWIILGADAVADPVHNKSEINMKFVQRIDLEYVNGAPIVTVWPKDLLTPAKPERYVVNDMPKFLADVAQYRKKVDGVK